MKTPWEIKRSLFCCSEGECHKCYYENECDAVRGRIMCNALLEDNMAYIQQLEKERDTLLDYLASPPYLPCDICKHNVDGSGAAGCKRLRVLKGKNCFEWNGRYKNDEKE